MKTCRHIAMVLVFSMLLGMFAGFTAFAADEAAEIKWEDAKAQLVFDSEEAKLATMTLMKSNDRFELYVDKIYGGIAVKELATGLVWFSSPWDAQNYTGVEGMVNPSQDKLKSVYSQVTLKYFDNVQDREMTSFTDAALKKQIIVKETKYGVRVEYTMGREEQRRLVPERISKETFENEILAKITNERAQKQLKQRYTLYSLEDYTKKEDKDSILVKYPMLKDHDIYALIAGAVKRDYDLIEKTLKEYTEVTFDTIDAEYDLLEYAPLSASQPVFKFALEYKLNEDGVTVRLPMQGMRYDMKEFKLISMAILPYFGAGSQIHGQDGYVLLPDGSGTLIRYNQGRDTTGTTSVKIYGEDFGYYQKEAVIKITEAARMPIFGLVAPYGDTKMGTFAVIEEGESFATVQADLGNISTPYNNVFPVFDVTTRDSYKVRDYESGSVRDPLANWTVYSKKKYTGSFQTRYFLSSGEDVDYSSFAKIYREYLIENGTINPEYAKEIKKDIPLYLEAFGTVRKDERFIGIPVRVKREMTTFDEAQVMLQELLDSGISNINLKYRGWYNGGMLNTAPSKINIEGVVGGRKGFENLLNFTNEKGIGFYPSVDLVKVETDKFFDGFVPRDDNIRRLDNRLGCIYKMNQATQTFMRYTTTFLISPNKTMKYYDSMYQDYSKFGLKSLSLDSLGAILNTDNRKKNPVNREAAKDYVVEVLEKAKTDNGSLMLNGGNIYAIPYADHIIGLPLESSYSMSSSDSVPFMEMVLHGCVNYAGKPMNLAGDYQKAKLKAIESGAGIYFTLSDAPSDMLKNTYFTQYFSINYQIWKDDLIDTYKEVNDVNSRFADQIIVRHDKLGQDVYRTTYEKGGSVVVNYSNDPFTVDGKTILPLDYAVFN